MVAPCHGFVGVGLRAAAVDIDAARRIDRQGAGGCGERDVTVRGGDMIAAHVIIVAVYLVICDCSTIAMGTGGNTEAARAKIERECRAFDVDVAAGRRRIVPGECMVAPGRIFISVRARAAAGNTQATRGSNSQRAAGAEYERRTRRRSVVAANCIAFAAIRPVIGLGTRVVCAQTYRVGAACVEGHVVAGTERQRRVGSRRVGASEVVAGIGVSLLVRRGKSRTAVHGQARRVDGKIGAGAERHVEVRGGGVVASQRLRVAPVS